MISTVVSLKAEVVFRFEGQSVASGGRQLRRLQEAAGAAGFELESARVEPGGPEQASSHGTAYAPLEAPSSGPRIRPIALALIRRGDEILVGEGWDGVKDETFFRLLGGTIEFGENGADAVRRELLEELGAESVVERLVGALENVFTFEGEPGHELALVYECELLDDRLYSLDAWEAQEETRNGAVTHRLSWRPLESFRTGAEILYPEGLLALLAAE